MKKLLQILVVMLLSVSLFACSNKSETGLYKAGTYTAQGQGRNGDITVEVEFSSDEINLLCLTKLNTKINREHYCTAGGEKKRN